MFSLLVGRSRICISRLAYQLDGDIIMCAIKVNCTALRQKQMGAGNLNFVDHVIMGMSISRSAKVRKLNLFKTKTRNTAITSHVHVMGNVNHALLSTYKITR